MAKKSLGVLLKEKREDCVNEDMHECEVDADTIGNYELCNDMTMGANRLSWSCHDTHYVM